MRSMFGPDWVAISATVKQEISFKTLARRAPALPWWLCLALALTIGLQREAGAVEPTGGREEALKRAMESVKAASARAAKDPARPVYHFMPPAFWMNDPNGPIQHNGYYHLFYQHNPYGDQWGNMHWGHARSRNLVDWEHLPIALWPSKEDGEDHCFSGCTFLTPSGQPMIYYTSIGPKKNASDAADQWAAVPEDSDLLVWKKHAASPVLTEKVHGETKIFDWRDPFVFREGGATWMVLGGHVKTQSVSRGSVLLYRAKDPELKEWEYRGILFQHPDPNVKNIECPNFFKLDGKWVLVHSPHGPVQYHVGEFDAQTGKFTSRFDRFMDRGEHYYAPTCLEDGQGRRIMWGWIRGFKDGQGWNGCLTLPRVLKCSSDGWLTQEPVAELAGLRNQHYSANNIELLEATRVIPDLAGDRMEIIAEFDPSPEKRAVYGLRLRRSEDGSRHEMISYSEFTGKLHISGVSIPFARTASEATTKFHIFLDRSVMEVIVNGRESVTRVVRSRPEDLGFEVFSSASNAAVKRMDVWQMREATLKPAW